jgi:hypothetical protein
MNIINYTQFIFRKVKNASIKVISVIWQKWDDIILDIIVHPASTFYRFLVLCEDQKKGE